MSDREGCRITGGVLVTGGAGYIGSHVVKQLVHLGESVTVLDDLSNGSRSAVDGIELIEGDVQDYRLLRTIIQTRRIKTIMHFAAAAVVSESVENPAKYYRNNTAGTAILLQCAEANGVTEFIFSSTAAVYGIPEEGVCRETSSTNPINPYGRSKLMSEEMLRDISAASRLRHVILRYFNVAGADSGGKLGQRGRNSTHITKIACEAAVGARERLEIYGVDYPTPDGTCIRDYIHVQDLAAAHISALHYLRAGGESTTLNVGYGRGFSVREIIGAVERSAAVKLKVDEAPRRTGDPPVLIASTERIRETLDWIPEFDDIDLVARTSLDWERKIAKQ